MTAINAFINRAGLHILTDGAGYDTQGVMHTVYAKCVPIPHLKAAVVVRGSALAPHIFAACWGAACRSFDELIRMGARLAEDTYDASFAALTSAGATELDFVVGGWSDEAGRFRLFAMHTNDTAIGPAWQFVEMPDGVCAPMIEEDDFLAVGLDPDIDPETLSIERHGRALLEAQRRRKQQPNAGHGMEEPQYGVGGNILYTLITAEESSQRVIHEWSDEFGKKICPEHFSLAPARTMSRQERRAMERQAKKKAVA